MKPVRDLISREIIDDLWGAGYTILPRRRHPDPFFVPPEMVPSTRSYQWMHLVEDKAMINGQGWVAVPASRHDGYFMPAGHVGDIEVSGLGLFEKPKVGAERAESHAKAHQNVADWIKKAGSEFSGAISAGGVEMEVGDSELAEKISGKVINAKTKSINTKVGIPKDMIPHMAEVFAERDRLYNELVETWNNGGIITEQQEMVRRRYEAAFEEDPTILKGPSLNALLLPLAIENVRKQLAKPKEKES